MQVLVAAAPGSRSGCRRGTGSTGATGSRTAACSQRFAAQVRRDGGIVVAAHPYCPFVGCDWRFGYDDVDGIEVWNGPWTLDDDFAVRLWDGQLRAGRRLAALSNSDAHNPGQVVGLPQTVVPARRLGMSSMLAGLAAGRSWLAESAAVDLRFVASTRTRRAPVSGDLRARRGAPVLVRLRLRGVPTTTVTLHTEAGVRYTERVGGSGAATLRWTVRAGEAEWVRAEVRRAVPTAITPDMMVALTNPMWLGAVS